jgi:ribosomal protein L37AE/L43A
MYYGRPPRIFVLTKAESETGRVSCPRCKSRLAVSPYSKTDKLFSCRKCGFKILKSSVFIERRMLKTEETVTTVMKTVGETEIMAPAVSSLIAKVLR